MNDRYHVDGYAIVSIDGMIADSAGHMPDSLKVDADQAFLQDSLDRAQVLVHGAHSDEGGPRAERRRRIVVTRRVPGIAPHPDNPLAMYWNPAGAAIENACHALGVDEGLIAVLGGTEVFDLFLPLYEKFYLTRTSYARLPGGRPVFTGVPAIAPEDLLAKHGLKPGPARALGGDSGVTLVAWSQ
jgi:dihydrofolate reductase